MLQTFTSMGKTPYLPDRASGDRFGARPERQEAMLRPAMAVVSMFLQQAAEGFIAFIIQTLGLRDEGIVHFELCKITTRQLRQ